jgi:pyridine nucleotide-disulfide oxidoreductase family protein
MPGAARGKVVLVGGGHAHVQVLESLRRRPFRSADVTVVVDRPVALYSGMASGLIAGQYRVRELEIDLPALCAWAGAECIVDPMVEIDAGSRRLSLASGNRLAYDVASINVGSTVAGMELPGIRSAAIPTRPIGAMIRRTEELVESLEGRTNGTPCRLVVVGGGVGGIELAFAYREALRRSGREGVETTVVHAGDRILEGYPAGMVRRVEKAASPRGIEILCNREVRSATPDHVVMGNGDRRPHDVLVWVTGPASHGIVRRSGLPVDGRGFARIHSTLQAEGHDDLFAAGDCATLIDHPDTPKAGVYAVRQGPVLTHNIRAVLDGRPPKTYRPQRGFLTLMNLGDKTALGAKWGFSFRGRWVMKLKDRIDRKFVSRFQVARAP